MRLPTRQGGMRVGPDSVIREMARFFSARVISSSLRTLKRLLFSCGLPRPVVAPGAHLQQDGLAVGAELGKEAELLHRIGGEDVPEIEERLSRCGRLHDVLIRPDRSASLCFVGHVDARVGHRDRLTQEALQRVGAAGGHRDLRDVPFGLVAR